MTPGLFGGGRDDSNNDVRFTKIESTLETMKDTLVRIEKHNLAYDEKLRKNEDGWKKAVETISEEFKKQIEVMTHTFADTAKEFVRKSEYQTLKFAVMAVVIAVLGQMFTRAVLG